MSLNISTNISKTNRHTLSSTATTKTRFLLNQKFISFIATLLVSQFLITVTFQKAHAYSVKSFYNNGTYDNNRMRQFYDFKN